MDSHYFDADPDPAFHIDADPDPDPTTHFFQIWTLRCSKMTLSPYPFDAGPDSDPAYHFDADPDPAFRSASL